MSQLDSGQGESSQFHRKIRFLDACASTIAEGKTLLDELKSANNAASDNSASSVQATLDRLSSQRDELGEYRGLAQYIEFKFRWWFCVHRGPEQPRM